MRAITGRIPRSRGAAGARGRRGRRAAWRGRRRPSPLDAIDDLEHDLSVLASCSLDRRPRRPVRGHAHYLLRLNEALKRSVTARWARARSQWTPYDGIDPGHRHDQAAARTASGSRARPYSLSALQKFSRLPVPVPARRPFYRLEPARGARAAAEARPADARQRCSTRCRRRSFVSCKRDGLLPVTRDDVRHALATLDAVVDACRGAVPRTSSRPAIERVWRRRDRRHRARPARLGAPAAARRRRLVPGVLRVRVRSARRRGPRSARACRSRSWSTAASCCAARSI